ncbi:hypothetical protein BN903_23 [Halorubrum sp. AJ67]|nr:hypothetical protein BN903_23 [Halorubrum sp. AJ67]
MPRGATRTLLSGRRRHESRSRARRAVRSGAGPTGPRRRCRCRGRPRRGTARR